ncbi:hypothetical protein ACFLYH_00820 [Candidatus Dependentiae bacterium]
MPISKLGIIGNLIFAPILSLFLIISSLIFFSELLCIPNIFLVKLLDKLTIFWEYFLNIGKKSWLIGFCQPNIILLFLIPILTISVLTYKKLNSLQKKTCALGIFFCLTFSVIYLQSLFNKPKSLELLSKNKKLQIISDSQGLILKDNGFLSQKRNLANFLEYELKPYCLKNFGTIKIDNLKFLKKCRNPQKIYIEFNNVFEFNNPTNKKLWVTKKYRSKIL